MLAIVVSQCSEGLGELLSRCTVWEIGRVKQERTRMKAAECRSAKAHLVKLLSAGRPCPCKQQTTRRASKPCRTRNTGLLKRYILASVQVKLNRQHLWHNIVATKKIILTHPLFRKQKWRLEAVTAEANQTSFLENLKSQCNKSRDRSILPYCDVDLLLSETDYREWKKRKKEKRQDLVQPIGCWLNGGRSECKLLNILTLKWLNQDSTKKYLNKLKSEEKKCSVTLSSYSARTGRSDYAILI